jgi:hypothetical protein
MPIGGTTVGKSYARIGKMRVGATRLDYYQPWFKVYINGVDQTSHCRVSGCSITQTLNGQPDTATMRVSGITVTRGQQIAIYMGDVTLSHCVFGGHVLRARTVYEGDLVTNVAYDLSCIDYTWRLNDKAVNASYTSTSATTIVTALMATYASWATTVHVAMGLPTVDAIQFTNQDLTTALDNIAKAIGGYWYLDYAQDLHFFTTDDTGACQPVTDAHASGWAIDGYDQDLSQTRTRAIVIGGGSNASTDIPAGSASIPVLEGGWYDAGGGLVQCGPQRIGYAHASTTGGEGCVTSGTPGSAPSPPSVIQSTPYVVGNLFPGGNYQYVQTFVSAIGESSASSAGTGSIAQVPFAVDNQPSLVIGTTGGSLVSNGHYSWAVTFVTAAGEVGHVFTGLNLWPLGVGNTKANLSGIPISSDPRVTSRRLYRTQDGGGSTLLLLATIADNVTTTYTDTTADASLGAAPPATDTGSSGKLTASIAIGPTGTTARKLYRTTLGGSTFKLQSTTSDNTTTSVLDNTLDGSLGATFSGSTLGAAPGDTSIRVSDLSKFGDGGWLRAGSQLVSFASRSATSGDGTLDGVPASGAGAITATIPAGATIVTEPFIYGIPTSGDQSILYDIKSGDPVNVRVEVNDTAAQTALAGYLGTGDGVIEAVITDGRLSIETCTARGDAELAEFKDPISTVTGKTRDQTVRAGRALSVTLTYPPISGTFKVQRVTLSEIAIGGATSYVFPVRTVDASSTRFAFEDLMRQFLGATAV